MQQQDTERAFGELQALYDINVEAPLPPCSVIKVLFWLSNLCCDTRKPRVVAIDRLLFRVLLLHPGIFGELGEPRTPSLSIAKE